MKSLEKYMLLKIKRKIHVTILLIFCSLFLFYLLDFNIKEFIESFPSMLKLLKKIATPNFKYIKVIRKSLTETIHMSLLGTFLGIGLSIPVVFFTASNIFFSRIIGEILNRIFSILRTIPSLIWAALLVSFFSIGKFSGVISLAIIGFLISQKLLRERIEEIKENKLNALLSVGASKVQVMKYLVIPEMKTHLVSLFFIVLESNIRNATILGLVGAGGIGQIIWKNLNHLKYENLSSIILALFILIFFIDVTSLFLRSEKRIIIFRIKSYKKFIFFKNLKKLFLLLIFIVIFIFLNDFFSINYQRFIKGLLQGKIIFTRMIDVNFSYFSKTLLGIYESFIIAIFATFFGGIMGFFFIFFASNNISNKYVSLSFKAVVNLMRTIPPMVVAIIFFRGLGPGKLSGSLALTVYTLGVLTKMHTEIIENVNKNIKDSIMSTGASKIGIYRLGLFEETFPSFIGLLLYRLESNIRDSTILGIIGAGGIGTLLNMNIMWRNWENVGLIILEIGIMIGSIDLISKKLRMKYK